MLPDTLKMLLTGFASMARYIAMESTLLGLPDLAWLLSFLQLKQNFLNHHILVLWSTAFLPFAQQMFLIASTVLWPSLNL